MNMEIKDRVLLLTQHDVNASMRSIGYKQKRGLSINVDVTMSFTSTGSMEDYINEDGSLNECSLSDHIGAIIFKKFNVIDPSEGKVISKNL